MLEHCPAGLSLVDDDGRLVFHNARLRELLRSEEEAQDLSGFASAELERLVTMFRSPPGRELYEVAFADVDGVLVA